jgi:peptidyl-tRNA hydrolase
MAQQTSHLAENRVFQSLSTRLQAHHTELERLDNEINKLSQQKAIVKMSAIVEIASIKEVALSNELIDRLVTVC